MIAPWQGVGGSSLRLTSSQLVLYGMSVAASTILAGDFCGSIVPLGCQVVACVNATQRKFRGSSMWIPLISLYTLQTTWHICITRSNYFERDNEQYSRICLPWLMCTLSPTVGLANIPRKLNNGYQERDRLTQSKKQKNCSSEELCINFDHLLSTCDEVMSSCALLCLNLLLPFLMLLMLQSKSRRLRLVWY